MKRALLGIVTVAIAALVPILILGQDQARSGASSTPRSGNLIVAQGATARLSLQTQLSSKLNEVGDPVTAVLYEAVRDGEGRIAIPKGTEFTGRVTQVQEAKRPQKQATMTIVFESMRMPYGAERVATVVTAIDDYANDEKLKAKDDEGKVAGGRSGSRTARNAGIGGGLGSLGGMIIGAAGAGLAVSPARPAPESSVAC